TNEKYVESASESGAERGGGGKGKHPWFFLQAVKWTLGPLNMTPPNLAEHPALIFSAKDWGLPTPGSDPSYQFLVPNGLSLPASLVALRQDFLRGGGTGGRNRQPPHPPERERICTVHVNRAYGVVPEAHDKHFNYLDVVLTTDGGGAYNAEQPVPTGDGEAEAYDGGGVHQRRNVPLVEAGRSDDSCGVLNIWRSKGDCRSIRFDSLESSRAEPIMTSRNVRSGKKTYMITFADQYICLPLRLALRYRDNGESIYHDSTNDGLLPHGHSKFADRAVGPAGNETNWCESTQIRTYSRVSGRHPGCLRKLMGVLPLLRRKLPRDPGAAKIRTFWLEREVFFNQHSLNRRARNWGNSLFGRGGIYRYINRRADACEWLPNHYELAEVPAGENSPRRNHWTAHGRTAGVPTRGPSGWSRRPSVECPELPPIRERSASTVRDLKNVSYPSSDATGALVAHSLEMTHGALGTHRQYQLWQDEPTTVFTSSYGAAPGRFADTFENELNEPDDTGHKGEPPGVNAFATLGLYEPPFGTAEQGVENGFAKTCSCSVGTLQSSHSSRTGRRMKGPSPRRNHRVESPNNHNVTRGQPCSTLLAYILRAPTRAPLNSDGGSTGETPTIQPHIYKSLSHEHSRGNDGLSMPAHGSSYQFFGSPARNTGLAHGGMSGTGSTATNSYGVVTFPGVNRRGKLELARGGWLHIRARVIDGTLGHRSNDLPREGSSLLSPMLGQSRAESGASGIHDETVYRLYRIEESLGPGGNGAAGKESPGGPGTTNYLSFHPPRVSRPFEGVEGFTKPWWGSAIGIYELLRARAPQFLTHKWGYSSEATLEALSNISPQRSKFRRTDTRRWVRFPFGQPSYESAFGRPLGNDSNSEYLAMGALLLILPVLIGKGLAYIELWVRLGVTRYWPYPLQKHGLGGSTPRGSGKHRGREQQKSFTSLVADPVADIEHCVSIGGYYLLLHGGITSGWLYNDTGFDIYPPLKLLQIQFVVTDENNNRHELGGIYDHALSNKCYGYRAPQRHGPHHYLRCLAKGYNRDMPKHMLHHSDSGTEVSSALWQRMTPLDETSGVPSATPQSGFSPSKGILLIGPSGMGRSYLMNDLAADSDAPLVPISSSSLYETEYYIAINDGKTNEMELPATSSCRLIILGGLVERISPRVVWIQDTHKFGFLSPEGPTGEDDVARVGTAWKNKEMDEEEERGGGEEEKKEKEEVEGKKRREIEPPTFPLPALLILLTGPANRTKSMLVIGSTHAPGETDPSFICSNRPDRLVNARALSTPRRQNQFPIIPRSRRFDLADDNKFLPRRDAPRYKTLCSCARDLGSLANEVLPVKTYQSSIHYGNAISSVLLGQAIHDYNICLNAAAPHSDHTSRVGKAVARGTVVGSPSVGSLYAGIPENPTSGRQFSCMSEWYESPIVETTFGESTVPSLALGCLAGSAVHSWVALENRQYDSVLLAGSTILNYVPARADLAGSIAAECQWSDESQFPYDDLRFAYPARAAAEGPMWEAAISASPHPLMIGEDKCRRTKYTTARTQTKYSASGKPYSWADTAVFTPAGRTPTDFLCTSDAKDPNDLDYDLVLLFRRLSASFTRRHPGAVPQVSKYRQQMEKVPFTDRFPVPGVGCDGAKYRSPGEPASFTGKRFMREPSSPPADCKVMPSHMEPHMNMDKAGPMLRGTGADGAGDGKMTGGDTNEQLTGTPLEYSNLITSDEAPDKSIAKRPYSWSGRLALRGRRSITKELGAWPQFNRSPLFYPSFLDEGWSIPGLPHMGARSESPSQRQIWSGAGPLPDDAPTRRIISESHKYLMKGLSANVALLSKVIGILVGR
uniref:Hypothetical chloroplast RF21 n=1 Tax=Selaginella indica TaxID=189559 RepID=A0A410KKA1_9TRAC|nr:hypothetical chloroplast RF21 [Selaginella indica]QAR48676.1 hypothetical chloroplast RF21 [Selaginella indica]